MPTVTITTEVFATLGAGVAERLGMPDLPFVLVPHPVAHRPEDAIHELADGLLEAVRRDLTSERTP